MDLIPKIGAAILIAYIVISILYGIFSNILEKVSYKYRTRTVRPPKYYRAKTIIKEDDAYILKFTDKTTWTRKVAPSDLFYPGQLLYDKEKRKYKVSEAFTDDQINITAIETYTTSREKIHCYLVGEIYFFNENDCSNRNITNENRYAFLQELRIRERNKQEYEKIINKTHKAYTVEPHYKQSKLPEPQKTDQLCEKALKQPYLPTVYALPKKISCTSPTADYIFLRERGAKWLLHFTNAKNLGSILKNGILSRAKAHSMNIEVEYNDANEMLSNYISVSIEWINYKMLYYLRNRHPEEVFVIIAFSTEYLNECAYELYRTNAASGRGTSRVSSAEGLYYDAENRLCLGSAKYPTDPQAEVRIKDIIPAECIKCVYFRSEDDLVIAKLPDEYSGIVKVCEKPFGPRKDYSFWRQNNND
ncbi:DarT ssDNA thymidine ADP-ribosyltransferase family protein [Bacillota bacterium Meth-B3]